MEQRPLNFLSLFAGIGGIDLGLERAGMRCVGQVEINSFARAVLAKHWPDVPRFEDVRKINRESLRGIPTIDLIAGGFPCQDISNAGLRVGIEGERSGLWSEFYRIICEVRPRFVLVENVAALLVRGLHRVLGDLAAVGYDAEWEVLPASAFGAPHFRGRLFIVASNGLVADAGCRGPELRAGLSGDDSIKTRRRRVGRMGSNVACQRPDGLERELYGARQGIAVFGGASEVRKSTAWDVEPDVGRVVDGVSARVDRIRGLGNAVVPQVAEWIGRRIVEAAARTGN